MRAEVLLGFVNTGLRQVSPGLLVNAPPRLGCSLTDDLNGVSAEAYQQPVTLGFKQTALRGNTIDNAFVEVAIDLLKTLNLVIQAQTKIWCDLDKQRSLDFPCFDMLRP
jgi:hypothetical protein